MRPKRGQPEQAINYLEQAVGTAKAGQVQRLLAEAEAALADTYRSRGDSAQALRHATAAVASTTAAGSRFLLPDRLRGLAEIHAAQGRVAEANRIYGQAADIVEGIMVNVPSREAQARLIGVTSQIYEPHRSEGIARWGVVGAALGRVELGNRVAGSARVGLRGQVPVAENAAGHMPSRRWSRIVTGWRGRDQPTWCSGTARADRYGSRRC
jgi:tetratricopeptide (TPR) repeat protein